MIKPLALAAFAASLALVGVAQASEPAGLYVLVEEVEVGGGQGEKTEWIKIRGVFMNEPSFHERPPFPTTYGPKRGWAHFSLPDQKQELARLEWKDFTRLAKGDIVAFGSTHANKLPTGSVDTFVSDRKADARSVQYPVDHGMYLIHPDRKPAETLKTFQDK
jgi:hypothetical protein